MRKLMIIALLAIGFSINAQWKKDKTKDKFAENVQHFISNNDTIAKKWTELDSKENYTTSISHEMIMVWKVDDVDYLSFIIDDSIIKPDINTAYKTVVVMQDNYTIIDFAPIFTREDGKLEFILNLKSMDIHYLKTVNIKEVQVEINGENYVIDAKENDLDTDFIKRCSNLIWPSEKFKT